MCHGVGTSPLRGRSSPQPWLFTATREVITDRAPALAKVIEDLIPAALHNTGQYENNRVESDHVRRRQLAELGRRLGPTVKAERPACHR